MKVGVPGEFHEDRWQRTAEDSERLCSRAHGKQAVPIEFKLSRGKGELLTGLWHDDLAHRCLRGIPAWRRRLLTGLWHGDPTHRCSRGIPAWRRGSSGRSSARCRRDRTQVRDMRQGAASVKGCRRVSMEGRRQGLQASKAAGVLQKIEGVKGVRRGVKRCVRRG